MIWLSCSRVTLEYRKRSMIKREFGGRIMSRKASTRSVETALLRYLEMP